MTNDEQVPIDAVMASLRAQVGDYAGRVALLEATLVKRDARIAELEAARPAGG